MQRSHNIRTFYQSRRHFLRTKGTSYKRSALICRDHCALDWNSPQNNCSLMSLNVIQLIQSGAIFLHLWLSAPLLHTHTEMLTSDLSPHSNEHTLIHLRLTNPYSPVRGKTVGSVLLTTVVWFHRELIGSPFQGDPASPVNYVCPHRLNWNWKSYVPLGCLPNRLAVCYQAHKEITN